MHTAQRNNTQITMRVLFLELIIVWDNADLCW